METITQSYERLAPDRPRSPDPPAPRPNRLPTSTEIRPLQATDRDAVIALLGASLGWLDDQRHRDLFAWKHDENPFGPSMGWVAEDPGGIAAVRLFMRWDFSAVTAWCAPYEQSTRLPILAGRVVACSLP